MANVSISAPAAKKNAALRKKAYDAFHNAKQRCGNKNNPSYENYGKHGIKVLFADFDEFFAHIGLPPNPKASLDRIDPNGNYEPGNVRWASPSTQAINKKAHPLSSVASISKQKSILLDMQAARRRREEIARAWSMVVNAINRGGFSSSSVDFLVAKKFNPEMFEAGWEPGQVRDLAEAESYFHMPSLTQLERRIRLEGGPLPTDENSSDSVISGLEVCEGSCLDAIKAPFLQHENGAILIGGKSDDWQHLGGVEGIMMVAASRLKAKNYRVNFAPLMIALDELRSLGASYKWDELPARILDSHWLFIPDFQIEFGKAVQPSGKEWVLLANLIDYRKDHGKLTYLGVQNMHNVPPFVREKLLLDFFLRELPETPVLKHQTNTSANGPKPTTFGFNALTKALTNTLYKTPG